MIPKAGEHFQEYYDKLIGQTINARAHLKLWERLNRYNPSYLDELNQAPHFFTFTVRAHLDGALLTLSRILDRHEDALSIWKFLDYAEQNLEIFSTEVFRQRMKGNPYYESLIESHTPVTPKEVDEDKQKLEKLEQTVNNLTTWRNKVIAHIDRKFLLAGKIVSKEYPLQHQQLQEVVDTLLKILNRYSNAYKSSSYSAIIPGEDDVQIVMDCIRFYIQEQKRRIEAELEALKRQNRHG